MPDHVSLSALIDKLSLVGEDIHMDKVNNDKQSSWIVTLVTVSIVAISAVNIPILREIRNEKKYTFITILVGIDCIIALTHIPTLGKFCW